MCWNVNNLFGWAMSQKMPADGFGWIYDIFNIYENSIQSSDENSNKGYILEDDVNYPRELHKAHSDLPF